VQVRGTPIFAAFNQLKSDFLAARWILPLSHLQHGPLKRESIWTTLDYATYGVAMSELLLAQRSAVDILDRVAVARVEYLHLSGDSHSIRLLSDGTGFGRGQTDPSNAMAGGHRGENGLADNQASLHSRTWQKTSLLVGLADTPTSRGVSTHGFVSSMISEPAHLVRLGLSATFDLSEFKGAQPFGLCGIARASMFYSRPWYQSVRRVVEEQITLPLSVYHFTSHVREMSDPART